MRPHWLIIMFYQITGGQEVVVRNLCAQIVSLSFQEENNRCLCYISHDSHVIPYVHESLREFGAPIILECAERFTKHKNDLECSGYVVVSASKKYLQRVLAKRFEPHKRILIFFKGRLDFASLRSPVGVDVVVADGFPEDPGARTTPPVRIFSITRNKTLGGFHDGIIGLRERDFAPEKNWKPAAPLKISAFNCTPFVYTDVEGGVSDGIDYFLVKQIFGGFPVEFAIKDYTPYQSMYKVVVRDVENDASDLGICSLWQRELIKYKVDISYPYGQICSTFLVPKPYLVAKAWFVYEPLSINLWATIFLAWLAMTVLLHVFARSKSQHVNFGDGVLHSIRIVTLGSIEKFPSSTQTALRIILTSWCLTSLLLTTAYSSGFSSILTYPRYTKPIKSLSDMVDHNIVSTYVNRNFSTDSEIVGPPQLKLIERRAFRNVEARNLKFREHKYAVPVKVLSNTFVTDAENIDEYGQRQLVLLSQCHSSENTVFILRRHSPLKRYVNERIVMLHEFGIVEHWFRHVILEHGMKYMRNFFKIYSDPLDTGPLKLKDLQGIFYLLLTGYGASVALFSLEIRSVRSKK